MPALANYRGTGTHQLHNAADSICKTPLDMDRLLSFDANVDVYHPPNKRARLSSTFLFSGFESELTKSPSIEILPNECLFEILRRIPGIKERCVSSCVSKRWLKILTTVRQSEFSADKDVDMVSNDVGDDNGCLTRCLEGKKATDMRLAAIAVGTSSCGGLEKLSIRGSNLVTEFGISAIAHACPSLRALSLWNVPHVGDKGLYEVARDCSLLEKLDLCHCPSVSSKALIAIAQRCPNLTTLNLESCSKIGNEALQAIGKRCPKLASISIKDCQLIGDHGISSLVSSASPVLSKVKLHGLSITDFSLAVIGHYGKAISNLVLSNLPNVTERGFWVMGNARGLQKLTSLGVTSPQGVTDMSLEALANGCVGLKQICLRKCCFVSDNGLLAFSRTAQSLETLQLEECNGVSQAGIFGVLSIGETKLKSLSLVRCRGIKDLAFDSLNVSPCNSLRSLSIRNCLGFCSGGLTNLAKLCPQLQYLDLSNLYGLTDFGLLPLIANNKAGLIKVNLSGCFNLTSEVVHFLAKLHGETLEVLNLEGCRRITDSSLSAIAENCVFLRELDLSKCRITDSGVAALSFTNKNNLKLQVLSLSGCSEVSNKSLPFLKKLGKTLIGLNIQRCDSISNGAVQQVMQSLWRCNVLS